MSTYIIANYKAGRNVGTLCNECAALTPVAKLVSFQHDARCQMCERPSTADCKPIDLVNRYTDELQAMRAKFNRNEATYDDMKLIATYILVARNLGALKLNKKPAPITAVAIACLLR